MTVNLLFANHYELFVYPQSKDTGEVWFEPKRTATDREWTCYN